LIPVVDIIDGIVDDMTYQLRRRKRVMATRMRTSTCNSGPKPCMLLATASIHKRDAARKSNTSRRKVHVGAYMKTSTIRTK